MQAFAADATTENLPDGKQIVVAYENISEPMLGLMENCQQGKGVIVVNGRVSLLCYLLPLASVKLKWVWI